MKPESLSLEHSAALPIIEQRLQGADCLCLTGTGEKKTNPIYIPVPVGLCSMYQAWSRIRHGEHGLHDATPSKSCMLICWTQ
jgi:hypothetical protein